MWLGYRCGLGVKVGVHDFVDVAYDDEGAWVTSSHGCLQLLLFYAGYNRQYDAIRNHAVDTLAVYVRYFPAELPLYGLPYLVVLVAHDPDRF